MSSNSEYIIMHPQIIYETKVNFKNEYKNVYKNLSNIYKGDDEVIHKINIEVDIKYPVPGLNYKCPLCMYRYKFSNKSDPKCSKCKSLNFKDIYSRKYPTLRKCELFFYYGIKFRHKFFVGKNSYPTSFFKKFLLFLN